MQNKITLFLYSFVRRTRLRSTLPLVWGKQRLFSCCCNTWLILMLPQPTATPPSTSPPGRGRWRQPLCCWRLELHTHWPPRWVWKRCFIFNVNSRTQGIQEFVLSTRRNPVGKSCFGLCVCMWVSVCLSTANLHSN